MPDVVVADWSAPGMVCTIGSLALRRSIDEVELADNLWARPTAYYVYATLFPGLVGAVARPE